MFVRQSTHEAALANAERSQEVAEKALAGFRKLQLENRDLRAKLAVFTAPRARGPKGHFLPTKQQPSWDAVKAEAARNGGLL